MVLGDDKQPRERRAVGLLMIGRVSLVCHKTQRDHRSDRRFHGAVQKRLKISGFVTELKTEWYGGFSNFFNRFHVLSNM